MLVSIDYRYAFIMSWLIKISNRLSSWQVGPQIVKNNIEKHNGNVTLLSVTCINSC